MNEFLVRIGFKFRKMIILEEHLSEDDSSVVQIYTVTKVKYLYKWCTPFTKGYNSRIVETPFQMGREKI